MQRRTARPTHLRNGRLTANYAGPGAHGQTGTGQTAQGVGFLAARFVGPIKSDLARRLLSFPPFASPVIINSRTYCRVGFLQMMRPPLGSARPRPACSLSLRPEVTEPASELGIRRMARRVLGNDRRHALRAGHDPDAGTRGSAQGPARLDCRVGPLRPLPSASGRRGLPHRCEARAGRDGGRLSLSLSLRTISI
jgi:hypothetical protein